MRIIGDIHGNRWDYLKLIEGVDEAIQIGDLDFWYTWMDHLDPKKFRFFNDHYDIKSPHDLGDFGVVPGFERAFFMRGGFSIDRKNRLPGVDWFPEEELSYPKLEEAYEAYVAAKPEILLSHECALNTVAKVTDGRVAIIFGFPPVIETRTTVTLQRMLDAHKPKMHIFGHYHRDFDQEVDGVRSICLTGDFSVRPNKLNYFDIP